MSKIIDGIAKDLKAIPETLKAKTAGVDKKKLILMNLPYILAGYYCDKIAWLWRVSPGSNASDKMMAAMNGLNDLFSNPLPSFSPKDLLIGIVGGIALRLVVYFKVKNEKVYYYPRTDNSIYRINQDSVDYYIHFCNEDLYELQRHVANRTDIMGKIIGSCLIFAALLILIFG